MRSRIRLKFTVTDLTQINLTETKRSLWTPGRSLMAPLLSPPMALPMPAQ